MKEHFKMPANTLPVLLPASPAGGHTDFGNTHPPYILKLILNKNDLVRTRLDPKLIPNLFRPPGFRVDPE